MSEPTVSAAAPSDFLVWLPARRPAQLKIPDPATLAERGLRPQGHFTGQRHLLKRVAVGDRLWLFRAGLYGLKPPAVDALMIAGSVEADGTGVWMAAAPGSRWFGWNDASDLMARLRFAAGDLDAAIDPGRPLGPQLQTVRQLRDGRDLLAFAEAVERRPSLFVSYRWREARKLVSEVVVAAAEAGFAPWVDRWSAPRRLAQGDESAPPAELSALLVNAIGASSAAVVIDTASWGTSGWTAVERAAMAAHGTPSRPLSPALCADPSQLRAALKAFRESLP
jgi:hypothetical protein